MAQFDCSNRHYIDGLDLWGSFNVFVESGSDDFLKYPAAKENISHDWTDAHGVDVDLSKRFLASRPISLKCACIVEDEATFWAKHQQFLTLLMQPGKRRVQVVEFGQRSFFVYYKELNSLVRYTRILNTELIAYRFTLELVENEPTLDNDFTFLVDEGGNRILT